MSNPHVDRLSKRVPGDVRIEVPELPPFPPELERRFPQFAEWVAKLNEWRNQIRIVGTNPSNTGS
jgi:hypothetical protein